jgi:hypothetical protein
MKFIPEVIDLVEALVDIAASMTPQHLESEKCKTLNNRTARMAAPTARATKAPQSKPRKAQVPKKRGKP